MSADGGLWWGRCAYCLHFNSWVWQPQSCSPGASKGSCLDTGRPDSPEGRTTTLLKGVVCNWIKLGALQGRYGHHYMSCHFTQKLQNALVMRRVSTPRINIPLIQTCSSAWMRSEKQWYCINSVITHKATNALITKRVGDTVCTSAGDPPFSEKLPGEGV